MKENLLITGAFVALLSTAAQAQTSITAVDRKWDPMIENLLQQTNAQKATRGVAKEGIIISCTNAQTVAEAIKLNGHTANIITDNVITAEVPVDFIMQLAGMEEVTYIDAPRQFYPTMHTARPAVGADKIQAGEGLETPFTGKGVILGVIDQGFEYKHLAFMNANGESRVRAVWNNYANQKPTTNIPSTGDNISSAGGHATHVTCIAAGSKVKENEYYGIAPDAEIIMIPSNFREEKVINEAKYIADFAKKEGKPFVINMSFGSQIGPHDGSKAYDKSMSSLSCPGGILVAAMGNEGELKLHAHYAFTKDKETKSIIVDPLMNGQAMQYTYLDLWGQATDGKNHLTLKPFLYNSTTKRKDYKNDAFWKTIGVNSASIDPQNKKEHFTFYNTTNSYQQGDKKIFFGLEITGNEGDEFHAWVNPGFGQIYTALGVRDVVKGDNEYCVGEGAACIPSAVAVGSYNPNDGKFISAVNGNSYSMGGMKGAISSFSSRGPYLGAEMKPLVSAPGHNISSAISRYGGFDKNSPEIVSIISRGMSRYYYATMSGTSMASPVVTGIVALWLEANPELTYEQVKEIIKSTSKRDSQTGTREKWDIKRGYGKIDAYAGLKKALEMAEQNGISDQLNNSDAPVTLMKEENQTRVLFNNDETYANVALYNASGMLVKSEQLQDVRRGQETVVSTVGLPKGVYVLRINTTANSTAKKMLVK